MGSIFKHKKTCNEDRISILPDSVLTHILSLLHTKLVVSTSILSHRWKDLWRSVTNLEFADSLSKQSSFELNPNLKLIYMDFIDKVMINRDNSLNIDKFSVSCRGHYDLNRINKWVNLAIGQNVKEMFLDFYLSERFHLPKAIFACETLAILRLDHKILVDIVPSVVSLPSLKTLELYDVSFAQNESLGTIVNGCPVLEELVIVKCKSMHGCVLRIIGLRLKKLTLYWLGSNTVSDRENEVVVDAPSLEYLYLRDSTSEKFTMLNMGSLVDAKIDVSHQIYRFVSFCEYGNRIFALLQAISNIRSLSLSLGTVRALSDAFQINFPTFTNLTTLDLCVDGWSGWAVLPELLVSSPTLETLVFTENFHLRHGAFQYNLSPPEYVPNCLLFHLKQIEFVGFKGLQDEFILIKYFLENALVLERLVIDCHLLRNDDKITEKLQNFWAASRKCNIVLIY